jgi:hypothetical protein
MNDDMPCSYNSCLRKRNPAKIRNIVSKIWSNKELIANSCPVIPPVSSFPSNQHLHILDSKATVDAVQGKYRKEKWRVLQRFVPLASILTSC